MWTKPYGTTGKQVTPIGFGGMRFPMDRDLDANAELMLHAYRKGINYFDTAPLYYYGGRSEDVFGLAFQHMTPGTYYVSTKSMESDGAALRKSLEESLRKMGVPKIHFFHIWCLVTLDAWKGRQDGGAVAAALKAKEEGLVEHVVVSSHLPGADLATVLAEGPFEGVTLGYCAVNFPYRQKAVDLAGERGLGVVAMNPLGGGLIPQNAERLGFLRGPADRSVTEAALRFVVSQPAITTALVGFSNKAEVDEAVAAVENFEPYPQSHVDTVRAGLNEGFAGLCTGCQYCLPCPQGVGIPQLMDAYNHKVLSGGKDEAIGTRLGLHWNMGPEAAAACSLCGACETRCTQQLPIRERMKHIASLAEKPDA